MNQYAGIERKLDAVASAVKSLDKTSTRTAREQSRNRRRAPFDVDALTSEEVKALKGLIEHEDDLPAYTASQVEDGGEKVCGMYSEFDRLGLIISSADGTCIAILPMAHWAVEKYEQRARDGERETNAQWRHDMAVAAVSTAIGGPLGILGTLLGVILG